MTKLFHWLGVALIASGLQGGCNTPQGRAAIATGIAAGALAAAAQSAQTNVDDEEIPSSTPEADAIVDALLAR
jgi:hypothetical protein